MQKKSLLISLAGIVLLGAGCNQTNQPPATSTNTYETPSETGTSPDQTSDTFTLSGKVFVEADGEVKLQWSAPATMDPKSRIRLMHGSTPGREVGQGAYWQDLVGSTREYIWSGVKSGNRYFRVCELKDGACVQTSNEIELMVK